MIAEKAITDFTDLSTMYSSNRQSLSIVKTVGHRSAARMATGSGYARNLSP
jgi:hypothetical protein